jgi:putative ABC transport system substrate-binding protein
VARIAFRRAVVVALAALFTPFVVEAQQVPRVARIGLLCPVKCEGPSYDALREGLRALGWIEGRNLIVEARGAEGRRERLAALAAELVSLKVDLIVASSPEPTRAAKNATSTIPIVMIAVADPVAVGLAESLARPGGNLTGLATLVPGGFVAKSLELLKAGVPHASRIAVFWNSRNEVHQKYLPLELPPAAQALGVRLQMIDIPDPSDLEGGFKSAVRERAQALLVVGDPLFHTPAQRLPDLAARSALPAMYLPRDLVQAGGLMSYGPDFRQMFRRAAVYVDKILKGAKPADLPIEQPTKFELVVNLKTAKALGLTFPQSLLLRADELIQ